MHTLRLLAALFLLLSVFMGPGACDSKKAAPAVAPVTLNFVDNKGFALWVNHDFYPKYSYVVTTVSSVIVRDDVFEIRDADDNAWLVPRHRIIYVGKSIKPWPSSEGR